MGRKQNRSKKSREGAGLGYCIFALNRIHFHQSLSVRDKIGEMNQIFRKGKYLQQANNQKISRKMLILTAAMNQS